MTEIGDEFFGYVDLQIYFMTRTDFCEQVGC